MSQNRKECECGKPLGGPGQCGFCERLDRIMNSEDKQAFDQAVERIRKQIEQRDLRRTGGSDPAARWEANA